MIAEAPSFRAELQGSATRGPHGAAAVDLGPVDAIPIGEGRAYCFSGRIIAVFRPRDGGLYALDDRCPHRAGPLADGIVGGGVVICPLHGWKFQLASGRCLNEKASVRTYPVVLVEGRMRVLIEDER